MRKLVKVGDLKPGDTYTVLPSEYECVFIKLKQPVGVGGVAKNPPGYSLVLLKGTQETYWVADDRERYVEVLSVKFNQLKPGDKFTEEPGGMVYTKLGKSETRALDRLYNLHEFAHTQEVIPA